MGDKCWSRVQQQEWEKQVLSPYAALSGSNLGREYPEAECEFRTAFQRDRDRIIHSKAFRRLKHKTQVFIAPEGDHYRTRLTHTLEVAQISRTIARALRLNEDLTEAIALGHDLGHTPFGHAGEEALDEVTPFRFSHNEQSLRVVELLEQRIPNVPGLNLTGEVRDGILNHTSSGKPVTLEGQIVRLADRIAYINHDIDDAIRAGLLTPEQLPSEAVAILGSSSGERIDTLVKDIVINSYGKPQVAQSTTIAETMSALRQFMFDKIYIGSAAKFEEQKAKKMLQDLFRFYLENPKIFAAETRHAPAWSDEEGLSRAVCDYISGMTDRYAISKFLEHSVPHNWQRY